MVLGVYTKALGPVFARALRDAGVERAMVVCGQEGLDEISIAGGTDTWTLHEDRSITEAVIHPAHFGLTAQPLDRVAGFTPDINAATLTALLTNNPAPAELAPPVSMDAIRDFIVLNAAALLVVAKVASDFDDGVRRALESIKSGKAWEALQAFKHMSIERALVG